MQAAIFVLASTTALCDARRRPGPPFKETGFSLQSHRYERGGDLEKNGKNSLPARGHESQSQSGLVCMVDL